MIFVMSHVPFIVSLLFFFDLRLIYLYTKIEAKQ